MSTSAQFSVVDLLKLLGSLGVIPSVILGFMWFGALQSSMKDVEELKDYVVGTPQTLGLVTKVDKLSSEIANLQGIPTSLSTINDRVASIEVVAQRVSVALPKIESDEFATQLAAQQRQIAELEVNLEEARSRVEQFQENLTEASVAAVTALEGVEGQADQTLTELDILEKTVQTIESIRIQDRQRILNAIGELRARFEAIKSQATERRQDIQQ